MLQAIHDNLKGVFAMIILGVLAVVFIFWGVEFVSVGGLTATKGLEVNGQDVSAQSVVQIGTLLPSRVGLSIGVAFYAVAQGINQSVIMSGLAGLYHRLQGPADEG